MTFNGLDLAIVFDFPAIIGWGFLSSMARVVAAIVAIHLARALEGVKLPRRAEIMDNSGGATLGVIVSGLAVTLAAMLLSIQLSALNRSVGQTSSGALAGAVDSQVSDSQLIPVFLDMAPLIMGMLEPLLPGGPPPILDMVPQA